ncbi:hypothetical protein F4780DRAFT_747733 [Xylariomycetidae sp. FL0641]|nr:hypothetical protein F4780DRAFT_747733 [Xylariomycetidae sp. FL0641]
MFSGTKHLWALTGLRVVVTALAECTSYGIDYTNGGSYDIDASSDEYFAFTTAFQGCEEESIAPVLIAPSGDQYVCSAIMTTPQGAEVVSTCGIPYSSMSTGTWRIQLTGSDIAVQRTITLTVGTPETIVITATPTVIEGVTSTPPASTIFTTIATQTQTLILAPGTVTKPCAGPTQTVTITPKAPTIIYSSTIIRTVTDQEVTRHITTTVTQTAKCHYPTSKSDQPHRPTICIGFTCSDDIQADSDRRGADMAVATPTATDRPLDNVAATTVTVTETTLTVTSTSVTTLEPATETEEVFATITSISTPAPSTICSGGRPGTTKTITKPWVTITQTNIVYSTDHVTGTVMVGETKYSVSTPSKSATACWRAGGWMGA